MTTVPELTHAKLSGSGAPRWMKCSASVRRQEGVEDYTSKAAAEGTVAHQVAADIVKGARARDYVGKEYTVGGHTFTVDQDMLDAIQVYVHEVKRIIDEERRRNKSARPNLDVEVRLDSGLQRIDPDFGGMTDCLIGSADCKRLYVLDYKHGAGVYVYVDGNIQLRYYALGALLSLPKDARPETVTVEIVQPRCGEDPIRRETFPAWELMEFEVDLLEAAAATRRSDPVAAPGEHCGFCRALRIPGRCPEVEEQERQLMTAEFDVVRPMVPNLDPVKIGEAMKMIPQVERRAKEIREYAYRLAVGGTEIPGQKLVPKRAARKWGAQSDAEETFLGTPGAWTERKLKTVAQVEKEVGKKEFEKVEDRLVVKESSGLKLVPTEAPVEATLPVLVSPDEFDVVTQDTN